MQALDHERLGPKQVVPFSEARQRRVAVQEAATALTCTLLPAIEPVMHVTIEPREKHPLGQTVLKVNEQRELTRLFTRRYLQEQLLTVLAGTRLGGLGRTRVVSNTLQSRTRELRLLKWVYGVVYEPKSASKLE